MQLQGVSCQPYVSREKAVMKFTRTYQASDGAVVFEYPYVVGELLKPDVVLANIAQGTRLALEEGERAFLREGRQVAGLKVQQVLFVDRDQLFERIYFHVAVRQVHGFVVEDGDPLVAVNILQKHFAADIGVQRDHQRVELAVSL